MVGITYEDEGEAEKLRKWFNNTIDLRKDAQVVDQIDTLLRQEAALSVAITPGIFGCPHEEGIDCPEGGRVQSVPLGEIGTVTRPSTGPTKTDVTLQSGGGLKEP